MAQLLGLIITEDEVFRKQVGRLLRSAAVPVSVVDDRAKGASAPDFVIVDIRADASTGMRTIERLHATEPGAGIFAVAHAAEPDLILQAMRAGANEFFAWPPTDEVFHTAILRTAARREASQGTRPTSTTLVFVGAKGGAGTTTLAVNCGVEIARLSKRATVIVDLKAGLGEVGLFLGIRPRFSVIDAIDNLHRLDREFLRELVTKHKSGLDILAGSEQFERPGAADSGLIEELLRVLASQYEYVVIDAGSQINACTIAALYAAEATFLVANPDVASVRNAQRLLDRVRQLGAAGDRVRFILNRASEPFPIPLKQIEGAIGHAIHHTFCSDYKAVSAALNSGVPLAISGSSEIASQFGSFARGILEPEAGAPTGAGDTKRSLPGLEKLASLW